MKKLIPIILLFLLVFGVLFTVIKTRMEAPSEDPTGVSSVTLPSEDSKGEICLGYF